MKGFELQGMSTLPDLTGAKITAHMYVGARGNSCCNQFRNGENWFETATLPDGSVLQVFPARPEVSGEYHFHGGDVNRQWKWYRRVLSDGRVQMECGVCGRLATSRTPGGGVRCCWWSV